MLFDGLLDKLKRARGKKLSEALRAGLRVSLDRVVNSGKTEHGGDVHDLKTLPPRIQFANGTPVRLSALGVDYMRDKLKDRAKGAVTLALLHKPFYGYIIETLPSTYWASWDSDYEIGMGPSDAGDCVIACVTPSEEEPIWEAFMKYSGYLEEVPPGELVNLSGNEPIKVPGFPEHKQLVKGEKVVLDPSLESLPFAHMSWPKKPAHGVIEDIYPIQYLSPMGGSWDYPIRRFDCIVSLVIPATGEKHHFHHYSGWLKQV